QEVEEHREDEQDGRAVEFIDPCLGAGEQADRAEAAEDGGERHGVRQDEQRLAQVDPAYAASARTQAARESSEAAGAVGPRVGGGGARPMPIETRRRTVVPRFGFHAAKAMRPARWRQFWPVQPQSPRMAGA